MWEDGGHHWDKKIQVSTFDFPSKMVTSALMSLVSKAREIPFLLLTQRVSIHSVFAPHQPCHLTRLPLSTAFWKPLSDTATQIHVIKHILGLSTICSKTSQGPLTGSFISLVFSSLHYPSPSNQPSGAGSHGPWHTSPSIVSSSSSLPNELPHFHKIYPAWYFFCNGSLFFVCAWISLRSVHHAIQVLILT